MHFNLTLDPFPVLRDRPTNPALPWLVGCQKKPWPNSKDTTTTSLKVRFTRVSGAVRSRVWSIRSCSDADRPPQVAWPHLPLATLNGWLEWWKSHCLAVGDFSLFLGLRSLTSMDRTFHRRSALRGLSPLKQKVVMPCHVWLENGLACGDSGWQTEAVAIARLCSSCLTVEGHSHCSNPATNDTYSKSHPLPLLMHAVRFAAVALAHWPTVLVPELSWNKTSWRKFRP